MNETCSAQTYWYENGVQRADFCATLATHIVESLDGSRWEACDTHAQNAVECGARVIA